MKYFLYNLGCKVNYYEISVIKKLLADNGYFYDENHPDLIVINSCAVTHVSSHKSRQILSRYRQKFPQAIIVIMGCYSQIDNQRIMAEGKADIVLGTSNRYKIIELINQYLSSKQKINLVDENSREFIYEHCSHYFNSERTRAFLKIQDGCDSFCSYCLIPYARGKSRYRFKDDILAEVKYLVKMNYQEIVLVGIDMASYRFGDQLQYNFSNLLEEILKILPSDFRLRISSIEVRQIDDLFLKLIADQRIMPHFHLPLQAGSNEILRLMNRHYTQDEYLAAVMKIRQVRPLAAITSDIMVGFSGESDELFSNGYEFIKKCAFSEIHAFPYSVRAGTYAAKKYQDDVPYQIKKKRVHQLRNLAKEMHQNYAAQFLGHKVKVLIERYNDAVGAFEGYSEEYLKVFIPDSPDIFIGQTIEIIYDKIEDIY